MDEEKNGNIPYDPDINHIVDTTIWEEESYGFEEEERDHEELISSLTALGTGVLALGEMMEGMDCVFQTIDDILDGVDGRIIHYASDTGDWGEHIYIHEAPLKEFTHDIPVIKICTFPEDSILPGYHLYSAEETVERARSRLGEEKYDLFFNNCEHFAIWCKTNISNCRQIPNVFRGTAANSIIQLCKSQIIPTFHL